MTFPHNPAKSSPDRDYAALRINGTTIANVTLNTMGRWDLYDKLPFGLEVPPCQLDDLDWT